jgi:hypothetical protein
MESMEIGEITRKRRIIATAATVVVAALLVVITRRVESLVTIILPSAALHWMISNERRLAEEGSELPMVPLATRIALFVPLPAMSLALIAFWLPTYLKDLNPWGSYAVASFSLALLLVKMYERFLRIRRRMQESTAPKLG